MTELALMPLDDRGLLLGDGLFETLLADGGVLRDLDAHLARMADGCAALGLPPLDKALARRLCLDALEGREERLAVRLTLTGGSGGRGLDRPAVPKATLFATAHPTAAPTGPARLVTATVRRNEGSPASRWKTLSYMDNVLARREAAAAGADEALMLNTAGQLACAAAANLFWFEGGRLATPALGCGVLAGVERGHVMARARAAGIEVAEVAAPRAALDDARCIFITNSLIGLRGVAALDGRALEDDPRIAALRGAP